MCRVWVKEMDKTGNFRWLELCVGTYETGAMSAFNVYDWIKKLKQQLFSSGRIDKRGFQRKSSADCTSAEAGRRRTPDQ